MIGSRGKKCIAEGLQYRTILDNLKFKDTLCPNFGQPGWPEKTEEY